MRKTITISLPEKVKKILDKITEQKHLNRSEVVREALRQYFSRQEFRRLRGLMLPEAEKRDIYTDEDVFQKVS
jgi:metal-responsive CopG/Arc/MetJ family transcriptional regulator